MAQQAAALLFGAGLAVLVAPSPGRPPATTATATSTSSSTTTTTVPPVPVPTTTVPPATVPTTTTAPGKVGSLGPWEPIGHTFVLTGLGGEGLASVTEPDGKSKIVYRGQLSIPPAVLKQGWSHIGDPGAWGGYLVDAYQAPAPGKEKMFRVTTPRGAHYEFVHTLALGEKLNNSFAAISPDGRWLVSGEWGEMRRLLVFPSPISKAAGPHPAGGPLPLASEIELDRPVKDVQGCAFINPTELLCSTDDPGTQLWATPDQLLEVTLPSPLAGATVTAGVSSLGELPLVSDCSGTFEVEGIDYQPGTGILRAEVVPPDWCGLLTTVYEYRRAR